MKEILYGLIVILAFAIFIDLKVLRPRRQKQNAVYKEIETEFWPMFSAARMHYIDHNQAYKMYEAWKEAYAFCRKCGSQFRNKPSIKDFLQLFSSFEVKVEEYNNEFVEQEIVSKGHLFSNVNGKNLDHQQNVVAVTDEVNTLVIAGAGSGKTMTILGKVQYLTRVLSIAPEDILILAYNRKAAAELTERLSKSVEGASAQTFHKLGLALTKLYYKHMPKIASEDMLQNLIVDYYEHLADTNKAQAMNVLTFCGLYSTPLDYEENYSNFGEYIENQKGYDLEPLKSKCKRLALETLEQRNTVQRKSIRGEQLKSIEEVLIANFLFLNGVEYVYERPYPFETGDKYRKYEPDFYLPDYDIYWEHFGISRDMRLPWLSEIEERKYLDGIAWKRQLHQRNGTKLIESYSYWKSEGNFLGKLDYLLRSNGVEYKPVDIKSIYEAVKKDANTSMLTELIKLSGRFISLYKENGDTSTSVAAIARNAQGSKHDRDRCTLFLEIIMPIYEKYQTKLKAEDTIDFADMISLATRAVDNGVTIAPYKYVIVDEFQDISKGRCFLIKSIIKQTGAKLLCVGDDWQSIYRFAGSDIEYITHFDSYFGFTKHLKIERTYRFSKELISVVEPFIMKNKAQLQKSMVSNKTIPEPIRLVYYNESMLEALEYSVEYFIENYGADKSILVLLRNNFDIDFIKTEGISTWTVGESTLKYKKHPGLKISYATVHSSKGAEADNIILLNAKNSKNGFPNKMIDDPILQLVLAKTDKFEYAEERRLFYVALTRTKNAVHILVPDKSPSEFIREISAMESVVTYTPEGVKLTQRDNPMCPVCKSGHLVLRRTEQGREFVGCSNYPMCQNHYSDTEILKHAIKCPSCGGYMVNRIGRYGGFIGCSNYPFCTHTMNSDGQQNNTYYNCDRRPHRHRKY